MINEQRMKRRIFLLIGFLGLILIQSTFYVSASFISGSIDPVMDGQYDTFYESVYRNEEDGLEVFFANNDDYMAFFINSTQAITRVNLEELFILEIDYWDENIHANYSDNRCAFEMAFARRQDFTTDNKFKIIITRGQGNMTTDYTITVNVKPKTATNSYEINADMEGLFAGIGRLLFGAWYSGFFWAFLIIGLWRVYLKPWVFASEDSINRELKCVGKIIECEKSKKLPGLYVLKFKNGTKIREYYCKENYETLSKQVADIKFMLYFEFFRDLVPMKFAVPEEQQWQEVRIRPIRDCYHNIFVWVLKGITAPIPSTHLALWTDALFERETLPKKVVEVDYLVIDLMEDRISTVWDAEYEFYGKNRTTAAFEWAVVKRTDINNSQKKDLERNILKAGDFPREGNIQSLKVSNEHTIVDKFTCLKDSIKDRAARLQIKVIYEARMLELEYQVDRLTKLFIDTDQKYNTMRRNYLIDLKKELMKVREAMDGDRMKYSQFGLDILTGNQRDQSAERNVSNAVTKQVDILNEQLKSQYELELKNKAKMVEEQNKRIILLESMLLKKKSNDLLPGDLQMTPQSEATPNGST